MMSYGHLALHTNSHRSQDAWAKPSAPPDPIQYEFLPKIRPDFGHPAGRGGEGHPYLSAAAVAA